MSLAIVTLHLVALLADVKGCVAPVRIVLVVLRPLVLDDEVAACDDEVEAEWVAVDGASLQRLVEVVGDASVVEPVHNLLLSLGGVALWASSARHVGCWRLFELSVNGAYDGDVLIGERVAHFGVVVLRAVLLAGFADELVLCHALVVAHLVGLASWASMTSQQGLRPCLPCSVLGADGGDFGRKVDVGDLREVVLVAMHLLAPLDELLLCQSAWHSQHGVWP